jgi:hypothetical protein
MAQAMILVASAVSMTHYWGLHRPVSAEPVLTQRAREMTKKEPLSDAEILNDIKTKPTVPVWPHYGRVYDLSRGKSYEIAAKGGPEFLHIPAGDDRTLYRVITSLLRKKLGIEAA